MFFDLAFTGGSIVNRRNMADGGNQAQNALGTTLR